MLSSLICVKYIQWLPLKYQPLLLIAAILGRKTCSFLLGLKVDGVIIAIGGKFLRPLERFSDQAVCLYRNTDWKEVACSALRPLIKP